jgi:hypothetical protein
MFYLVDKKTGQRVVKAKDESFLIRLMNSVGYEGWIIEHDNVRPAANNWTGNLG